MNLAYALCILGNIIITTFIAADREIKDSSKFNIGAYVLLVSATYMYGISNVLTDLHVCRIHTAPGF